MLLLDDGQGDVEGMNASFPVAGMRRVELGVDYAHSQERGGGGERDWSLLVLERTERPQLSLKYGGRADSTCDSVEAEG